MGTLIIRMYQTPEGKAYDPALPKPWDIVVDLENGVILSGDPADYLIGFTPGPEPDGANVLPLSKWWGEGGMVEDLVGRYITTSQRGRFYSDQRPIHEAEVRD